MKSVDRLLAFVVALPLTAGALVVGSSESAKAISFATNDVLQLGGPVTGTIPPAAGAPTITFPGSQVLVLANGVGGFSPLSLGDIGSIVDIPPPSAFPPPLDPFVTFDVDGDSVIDFTFTLDAAPLVNLENSDEGEVFFSAFGRVFTATHGSARVKYDFTANGLGDGDPFGSIDSNGDGIIGVGSFSGTTVSVVPEPSTVVGSILALGGAAAFYRKKQQLKAKA
jgi:hypothetical protein